MNNGSTWVACSQFCYTSFARRKSLSNDSDKLIGDVTRAGLIWLVLLAVDLFGDHFWTTHLKFESFATHVLNENCKL